MKIDRIKVLGTTSILYILSLFSYNKLFLVISISIWLLSIIYNIIIMMKESNFGVSKLEEELHDRSKRAFDKNKYVKMILNRIAFPMIIVGIIIVALDVCYMWYMLVK